MRFYFAHDTWRLRFYTLGKAHHIWRSAALYAGLWFLLYVLIGHSEFSVIGVTMAIALVFEIRSGICRDGFSWKNLVASGVGTMAMFVWIKIMMLMTAGFTLFGIL